MAAPAKDLPILTVTQVTHAIKQCLESTFPSLWLQGEISNCKLHSSGHLYFSLKDKNASIAAVMFRPAVSHLLQPPKDGDHVIAYGHLNVYPPSGRYQIQVLEMRFAGVGELLIKLEELKKKLHQRGWFNKEHKKPLPKLPKKIGVVTSPTGAVIQDILHILTRRFSGFHVILNPVRVQGDNAACEIAQAIEQFNRYKLVDVMIVGRGGGSIEDLFAFNEEIVAKAIFESEIPVIAAVGHETDHCIAEYVADVRAPTPSAAAEMVIAEKAHQVDQLLQFQRRADVAAAHLVKQKKAQLNAALKQPYMRNPYLLLGPWMQKLDDLRQQVDTALVASLKEKKMRLESCKRQLLSLNPSAAIANSLKRLASITKQFDQQMMQKLTVCRERLQRVSSTLSAIDPKNLLTKGYSIVFKEKDKSLINTVRNIQKNEKIAIMLTDGEIAAVVEEVRKK